MNSISARQASNLNNFFYQAPTNVLIRIFRFTEKNDISKALPLVCKRFHKISTLVKKLDAITTALMNKTHDSLTLESRFNPGFHIDIYKDQKLCFNPLYGKSDIAVFDFETQKWSTITSGYGVDNDIQDLHFCKNGDLFLQDTSSCKVFDCSASEPKELFNFDKNTLPGLDDYDDVWCNTLCCAEDQNSQLLALADANFTQLRIYDLNTKNLIHAFDFTPHEKNPSSDLYKGYHCESLCVAKNFVGAVICANFQSKTRYFRFVFSFKTMALYPHGVTLLSAQPTDILAGSNWIGTYYQRSKLFIVSPPEIRGFLWRRKDVKSVKKISEDTLILEMEDHLLKVDGTHGNILQKISYEGMVIDLFFTEDLMVLHTSSTIYIWDAEEGTLLGKLKSKLIEKIISLGFNKKGEFYLIAHTKAETESEGMRIVKKKVIIHVWHSKARHS